MTTAKWVFITGLILWGLVLFFALNLIVVIEVLRYVWSWGMTPTSSLCTLLLVIPIAVFVVLARKARSITLVALGFSVLGFGFAITWFFAVKWSIVNYNSLMNITTFSLIFATAFTCVVMPSSLLIHRVRRKSVDELITKAIKASKER